MLATALTDRFGLRTPIVGAPMFGAGGAGLAAAVSAAGGLGMVGVGSSASSEAVADELAGLGGATDRFGVGLMAWAVAERPGQLAAVVAARPALVSVSFGDYAPAVAVLAEAGIASATQVGDVESARRAVEAGVEVVVARGAEAGGHGDHQVATLPLLQGVLDAVGEDALVVAAGGIATPRGLAAVLAAGADGAWIGTAFLAASEALTSSAARRRLIAATEVDTVYTRVFDVAQRLAWPERYGGRALANDFTARWQGREAELARDPDAGEELAAARARDDFDTALLYAGQGVGSLREGRSAGEIVAELDQGAEALLRRW